MFTYKHFDVNNAILAITEDKNEPEILGILSQIDLTEGDEISIEIKFKGKTKQNVLVLNRTIAEIKEENKEVDTNDKGKITLIGKDFILK